jgi:polyisoprenoid-binding protein YceI
MSVKKFMSLGIAALIVSGSGLLSSSTHTYAQTTPLYKSCEEDKLSTPLTLQNAANATAVATMAATTAAAPASNDKLVFLSIVGSDSEACYLATETFLENNMMNMKAGFNGAVGITKTIQGDIALDLDNIANSQIGDITINISEFKSDNDRRDGFIRQNFLQSNKYPFATLTNAVAIGLPTVAYKDGDTLTFQIQGDLKVHDTTRPTTFTATGAYTKGVLVVKAVTELKMSDFGITVPDIAHLLKVDDALKLEVNLVAREGVATPAATQGN